MTRPAAAGFTARFCGWLSVHHKPAAAQPSSSCRQCRPVVMWSCLIWLRSWRMRPAKSLQVCAAMASSFDEICFRIMSLHSWGSMSHRSVCPSPAGRDSAGKWEDRLWCAYSGFIGCFGMQLQQPAAAPSTLQCKGCQCRRYLCMPTMGQHLQPVLAVGLQQQPLTRKHVYQCRLHHESADRCTALRWLLVVCVPLAA